MPSKSRPMGRSSGLNPWGTTKKQRTISVTDEAWDLWTDAAEKAQINRSEMFEVLARMASCLNIEVMRAELLGGNP
jgi:hypothetical protein